MHTHWLAFENNSGKIAGAFLDAEAAREAGLVAFGDLARLGRCTTHHAAQIAKYPRLRVYRISEDDPTLVIGV